MKKVFIVILMAFSPLAYSQHLLKFIVPSLPGAVNDVTISMYAPCFESAGFKVVKDFRPGAEGYIALQTLQSSTNTENTTHVLLGNFGLNMMSRFPNVKITEDLRPLTYLNRVHIVFYVKKGRFQKLEDLVAVSKRRPINFASHSVSLRYFGETLLNQINVTYEHIPYKGTANVTVDILNDNLDIAVDLYQSVYGLEKEGRIVFLTSTLPQKEASDLGHDNVSKYSKDLNDIPLGLILSVVPSTNYIISNKIIDSVRACNKDLSFQEKLKTMNSGPIFLTANEIQRIVERIQSQIK